MALGVDIDKTATMNRTGYPAVRTVSCFASWPGFDIDMVQPLAPTGWGAKIPGWRVAYLDSGWSEDRQIQ